MNVLCTLNFSSGVKNIFVNWNNMVGKSKFIYVNILLVDRRSSLVTGQDMLLVICSFWDYFISPAQNKITRKLIKNNEINTKTENFMIRFLFRPKELQNPFVYPPVILCLQRVPSQEFHNQNRVRGKEHYKERKKSHQVKVPFSALHKWIFQQQEIEILCRIFIVLVTLPEYLNQGNNW